MSDVQIVNSQTQDGASAYVLPGTVELILKAVSAAFADNGAAGDWLPAVTVYSDSGHVVARAVDTAVRVTAGDDADVSWFPGVKHFASGSVATDIPWIRRRKLAMADQAFGSGVEPLVTWNSVHNDYPAVFALGFNGVKVLVDGLYSIVARLFVNNQLGNTPAELYLNNIDSDGFGRYPFPSQFPLYSSMMQGSTVARLVANTDIYVTCRQESGNPWTLAGNDGCYLELRRLGDATVVDTFG